ncbi:MULTISPECIES: shikimate dehydrogenase [unclassified Legionella]|uniref:shikimate dehydrogenase n=1 Tax=unclassified Legionella TaxID=2622702 RepID=UPI0010547EA7|nr:MULTISPECIES: shikimate dehydrogenase [unclassified Legionella]MDI9819061.1 shikimate dehydrogenase [Legionella sp. PL877]
MANYFAVVGNPVAHSLSPFIHQRFAVQTGRQLSYVKLQVEEKEFEAKVGDFFASEGRGLNITLPFKQRAFAMAQVQTPRCRRAGAANTLWMENEQLHADNTDGVGLIRDLSHHLALEDKKVLIIGAGGAARGIIAPLLAADIAQLTITNRTMSKAEALQADFKQVNCCRLANLQGSFDLIINATSMSLKDKMMELPSSLIHPAAYCYDLAYSAQGTTAFVDWARQQGCHGIDGLGMLVEQAAEAFFIWHGVMPDTHAVLAELRARQSRF